MKRCFRLTRFSDFKRVRNSGKAYSHPLVVLYVAASGKEGVRVGVSASKAVGNAVQRNRSKRLLRAAVSDLMRGIKPGSDLIFLARSQLPSANIHQTRIAVETLLKRAELLSPIHGD